MKNKLIQYPVAIIKQMVHDDLISFRRVMVYIDKKTGKIIDRPVKELQTGNPNTPPEAVKFCDSDKCGVVGLQ